MNVRWMVLAPVALAASVAVVEASPAPFGSDAAFTPQVPVSAFARPSSWFDPSRLQFGTSISFGSGFGGGSEGLQTTSLTYRFGSPLAMRVSVGRAFGAAATARGDGLFLEGFDVAYRPHPSLQFQIHYQDVRSPLQYGLRGYDHLWR
ncbi:MAG TPA: hypothetical protein VEY91_08790 [Candidatus Limnocylindria bacterium]|nr:hypothetical protein [Candidatus Limnocylindria bacterium]